jgi:hypothetical protein
MNREAQRTDNPLPERQTEVRNSRDIERCMERARDERAKDLGAMLSATCNHATRLIRGLARRIASGRPYIVLRSSPPMMAVAIAALTLAPAAGLAEEGRDMVVGADHDANSTDRAMLARFGLDPGTIESCEDVEALWRAVRELVLTQRVSEPMQQRILRRIWALDPEIASGSLLASETN